MLHENTKVSDSGTGKTRRAKRASRAARKSRRGGRAAPKVSLYDEVTAQIIAQLEEGVFPWVKPWNSGNAVTGLPRNAISGRHYSGINILILWGAVIDGGYPSQDWLTFRQALAAGGCVRKGEKGRTIFYADRFTPDNDKQEQEKGEGDVPRSIPFLKRFTVFNAAQCDGLPEKLTAEPAPLPERELHDQAEALIAATEADFRTGGTKRFTMWARILCRFRRNRLSLTRSIITAPPCTNLVTGRATRPALAAISPAVSGPRFMRGRNYAPNWPRLFSVLCSVSCRPSAMPTISALGWQYCGRTTAPLSRQQAPPAKPPIISWRLPIRCRCARSARHEQCSAQEQRRAA